MRPVSNAAHTRVFAARAVTAVAEGRSLDAVFADSEALPAEPKNQALVKAIVFTAIRWFHRFDWQLQQLMERPLARRDRPVHAVLITALAQIEELRVPEHAAVSTAVEATKLLGKPRLKGLVNGVLRRYLRERDTLQPDPERDPEAHFSHPRWLIDHFKRDWPDSWQAVLAANNDRGPMWLRVNCLQTSRSDYLAELAAAGLAGEPGLTDWAVRLAEPVPVGQLPGFEQGMVSVQDQAAQLAAEYLSLDGVGRVLDACSAPGGKSGLILERLRESAALVAVDASLDRMDRLTANLDRLGLTATTIVGDAAQPKDWWDGQPFDRILIDAPCSGTGVIRRHPDIKLLRKPNDVAPMTHTQARLISALWPLLVPGGHLVYATCSILRDENSRLIRDLLSSEPGSGITPENLLEERQILPGEANMDGFYYACLSKKA